LPNGRVEGLAVNALTHGSSVLNGTFLADVVGYALIATDMIVQSHPVTADTADGESLKECGPFPGGTFLAVLPMSSGILREPPLVFLEFLPRDVALVHIRKQRHPLVAGKTLGDGLPLNVLALPCPAEPGRDATA